MQYLVRAYQDSDREAVIRLWKESLPDAGAHNRPSDSIDRKLAVDRDLLLIAEVEGELLGTAMGGYDGHRGWIYSVAVKPSWRRRGVGSALLQNLEALLKDLGCPKVNLQVRSDNSSVVAFYERLGFQTELRVSMGKRI